MIYATPPMVTPAGTDVCLKLEFNGHEISVACDDSAGALDTLRRVGVRVYRGDEDVTEALGGPWDDADGLFAAMMAIAGLGRLAETQRRFEERAERIERSIKRGARLTDHRFKL